MKTSDTTSVRPTTGGGAVNRTVTTPVKEKATAAQPTAVQPQENTSLSGEAAQPEAANPINFGAWDGDLMKKGQRGDDVKALQEALNQKLGGNLKVDGIFGNDTAKAVREFQKKNQLDVDGLAGDDTQKALRGEGPAQAGDQAKGADQAKDAEPVKPGEEAGKTSKVGGLDDTSWTDKLPEKLKPHAQAFIDAGKKHGVDPRFLASISMQETGGGKSSAFRNKNNAMGISGKGGPKRFSSVGASIDTMARTLAKKDGYYKGKSTISQIGGVYAPIGAKNDPGGLNKHWVPNISRNFASFGGDPGQAVK